MKKEPLLNPEVTGSKLITPTGRQYALPQKLAKLARSIEVTSMIIMTHDMIENHQHCHHKFWGNLTSRFRNAL